MTSGSSERSTSTELTGGAGFTYEDFVVAYYLAALLREEHAAGMDGIVVSVAVQQSGHGHPMDDIIIEFLDAEGIRTLGLQVKQQIRITSAQSNTDFRAIMAAAVETRALAGFQVNRDAYGFATAYVALDPVRSLQRLIDWATASPTGTEFDRRFAQGGAAAAAERALRETLKALTQTTTIDEERDFYSDFVALHLDGLAPGGALRAEIINRLREFVAENEDGQDVLLFDRLCRIARDGAGHAQKWTRSTLLNQLRGVVRLRTTPNFARDVDILCALSLGGLAEVSETIDDFHVARSGLKEKVAKALTASRLVNISGMPGCGKSAILKGVVKDATTLGPVLFLKSDRLAGNSWSAFSAALGLRHTAADLLAEIGATGTPVLFIDGIDRVRPDQKGVIVDILRTIEDNPALAAWRVLATSRDQGLEAYRAWFPASFYRGSNIGNVTVEPFSDDEAEALAVEKPHLRRVLFGAKPVREIARRPFFAAVLARNLITGETAPQTETDLIAEWWARAGHDAEAEVAPQRKRALIDLAEAGVRNLGKNIPVRRLKESTHAHIATLRRDLIIREHNGGTSYSFTHDIFFEWSFYRMLLEMEGDWHQALVQAGEPPLLGRVIGLLAQSKLVVSGEWTATYRYLETLPLRPQWRREWLTAPPFAATFTDLMTEFTALLAEDDYALLEKLLVWFQAQHTIPNPIILQRNVPGAEAIDRIQIAAILGWPSDFSSWGRLLDWLLVVAPDVPVRLIPLCLEVFGVWQNALADIANPRSAAILAQCSTWLIGLEQEQYSNFDTRTKSRWYALGGEALSNLATTLRSILLRSARSFPDYATGILQRAIQNEEMRRAAYRDLMAFAPTTAEVMPDLLVAVAEAEIMDELPQARLERQEREERARRDWLIRLRAIPEAERTEKQKRALESTFFPIGTDRFDPDDIGIVRYHDYYSQPSALHEPFASLFAQQPAAALRLIRNISNHATQGWRQIHAISPRQMGTPLPVQVPFPWGTQEFWGNWRVYSWSLGELAPSPLECTFLALAYWAFSRLEAGESTSEIIQQVVEGNQCYAVLGLALRLALETYDVSAVTLPIVATQKLWHHDMARVVHEPTRNLDLLGWGFLTRLTGAKAQAKEFLDQRKSCKREVRELAMRFALSRDASLQEAFRATLAAFPAALPYELEEQRANPRATSDLLERAEQWAGLGNRDNYQRVSVSVDTQMITYEPPTPLTPEQEERLADTTTYLRDQQVFTWATTSLVQNKVGDQISLPDAVAFVRARDTATMFDVRQDVGGHAIQSAISAVAACVLCFATGATADHEWARDVMARVARMVEPEPYSGSKIPWHPALHLVRALFYDRRTGAASDASARQLIQLTIYANDDVAKLAFQALFNDPNEHVRWVAGQLTMDLSIRWQPIFDQTGGWDHTTNQQAREASVSRALDRLSATTNSPFPDVPPAWSRVVRRSRRRGGGGEEERWSDPDPHFDAQFAADIFPHFPLETWCQSSVYRPFVAAMLLQLVGWTAERLMPSWRDPRERRDRARDVFEWNHVLGDLLARAVPQFEVAWVRQNLLAPFLVDDEAALSVLSNFADKVVTRQVLDAASISPDILLLLDDCVERVVRDNDFYPGRHRAGEVFGHDLPRLINALLFVAVEDAPGAARFANGDWSQIAAVMPLITKLITAIGWSPFVMQHFLTLCERAGTAYPLEAFAAQANAVLSSVANARGGWSGTTIPARIAAIIYQLSEHAFPLHSDQALSLLRVLDALIDLGDRRSAALEQSETFRSVQLGSA